MFPAKGGHNNVREEDSYDILAGKDEMTMVKEGKVLFELVVRHLTIPRHFHMFDN